MAAGESWIDLLDPDERELHERLPAGVDDAVVGRLLAPATEAGPRPTVTDRGGVVFVALVVPVVERRSDRLFLQEVDLVLTPEVVLSVRKTPPGFRPFDPDPMAPSGGADVPAGVAYRLADQVAERFLDLVDDLDEEIEELEDNVEVWPSPRVRERLAELRGDVLTIRRTLAPTRDAIRRIVDGRVALAGGEMQHAFADVYDKLLRAAEGLEYSRELIAAVRDYHQTRIAQEQNDVIKKLTVIASLLLFPTFVVGVYGQNFDHMPELHWRLGYVFSWAVIVAATLAQLAFFRWRRWI